MIDELQEYKERVTEKGNKTIAYMSNIMDRYYNDLKAEVKLNEHKIEDKDDNELEGILATLKPNTTAKNFKYFLKPKDNNVKS